MRVLITGGTGFLGSAVARRLVRDGHSVTVLGQNVDAGSQLQREGALFVKADIVRDDLEPIFYGQDVIVHAAGVISTDRNDKSRMFEVNVRGTQNVIDASLKSGIKRLVNISSPSVYFTNAHRRDVHETATIPPRQASAYSESKLLADIAVEAAVKSQGLPAVTLRPRLIFGANDKVGFDPLVALAANGRAVVINGGRTLFDFTYIDNAVDAVLLAISAPKQAEGLVFNITNGEPLPLADILEHLYRALNMDIQLVSVPSCIALLAASLSELRVNIDDLLGMHRPSKKSLSRYAVALGTYDLTLNIDRARELLGYSPKVSMEQGIREYAEAYKRQKNNESR